MDRRMRVLVLSVAVVVCVLYALGPAFGAIDVPAKLKDIPLYEGSRIVHAMDMENNAMLSATVKASGRRSCRVLQKRHERKRLETCLSDGTG